MWLLLLLFSLACPGFIFCSSNFPYVCLWRKEKGGNMSLLDSVAPLRFWWSKGTVQ